MPLRLLLGPAPGHRRPFGLVVDGAIPFPFTDPPAGYRPCADGLGLTGPDGSRLLCLPQGHPVPSGGSARYDAVLIDLLDRPERLGELRRAGVVDDGTTVVAVGLDHRVRSEEELARRLRLWGARAVPDGTGLDVAPGRGAGRRAGRPGGRCCWAGRGRGSRPRRSCGWRPSRT
ncbi:hypothetical protein ACFQ0B_64600 [Nonomuraea thailandensis]